MMLEEIAEPEMPVMVEEVAEPTAKPKRESQNKRLKLVRDRLLADVSALEGLVQTLLSHLERSISADLTDSDRLRYRQMIGDIRKQLES